MYIWYWQQKIVIKVTLNDGDKSRTKAMKTVVAAWGVESVTWTGDDKSKIEVTGDGLDPATLTTLLRKKVGYADLVIVGPAEKEKPKDTSSPSPALVESPYIYYNTVPYDTYYYNRMPYAYYDDRDSSCSIM